MNPILQLNTGKLLNETFLLFTGLGANQTILTGNEIISTEIFSVDRESRDSIIQIDFSLITGLSVSAANGSEFLLINTFRNGSLLFSQGVNLFPVATGIALGSFPVFINFSYYDLEPALGSPITEEPINYQIEFTSAGFAATDTLTINTNSVISFKEVESPRKISISEPLN